MAKRTGVFGSVVLILSSVGKPVFYFLFFLLYGLAYGITLLPKIFRVSKKKLLGQKIIIRPPKIPWPTFKIRIPSVKFRRKTRIILFPKKKVPFRALAFALGCLCSLFAICYLLFTIFNGLPSPTKLNEREQILTTKIYDRNSKLLYKIFRGQDRTPVSLKDLPVYLPQATVAIEDKDFYHHQGLSVRGIARAAFQNIFLGKKTGGSTITQQLIKNTLLNSEKTWKRKIREAVLAVLVEKKYSKNQILEMYLNEVGYGGAAYGIEEAAEKYFGKQAKNLNLAEASLLAGLTASPTRYSPFGANPQLAKQRQELVLKRMEEDGYITEAQNSKLKTQKLEFAPQTTDIKAPHFVMYIKELLVQKYGEKLVEEGGLEVRTSLDLGLQEKVQQIVKDEINKLGNLHITNGAALVTNPKTGEILAMVGSKDYFAKNIDGNYNVTMALRQPGSAIKPVNYSIALENGFTPSSFIEDSPITYNVPGQEPYSPKNYDNRFHGRVLLRTALASSYNVPAVKILAAFGVKKMIDRGKEMGITTWNNPANYGLSLTLGGGEIKMTDLAVAYGVLANNGIRVDLNPILEVKDKNGKILQKNTHGKETPVLNPGVAFLLTDILSDNVARTPAFGSNSVLNTGSRPVAVKTGTTQNLRDNWTIGYTPSLLTAVWVGNNNNTPMSYVASGITGASPIWRKIMDNLLANSPAEDFSKPDEVKEVEICTLTGTLACKGCPSVKKEYFLTGTEPKFACEPEKIKETLEKKPQPTASPQIL